MVNGVLRQATQNLWNLVTRALRIAVISTSGDSLGRPGRQGGAAEEELLCLSWTRLAGLPGRGGPGQALGLNCPVAELTWFCLPGGWTE